MQSMYCASLDCCVSDECPKYAECKRAHRKGREERYYTMVSHEEWADSNGNHGSHDFYECGEKGNWRMFLDKEEPKPMSKAWNTDKTNLPKEGSVLVIALSVNANGRIVTTCGVVRDGKITMHKGLLSKELVDVTDKVIKWHRVPNIICRYEGMYWEDETDGI